MNATLLPTILAVITAVAVALAAPLQTLVASNPIASFLVALAGVVAAHFTPPPGGPPKVGPTVTIVALLAILAPFAAGCALLQKAKEVAAIVIDCSLSSARSSVPELPEYISKALASGDYLGALDELALDYGRDVVACSLGKLSGAGQSKPSFAALPGAAQRAQEYLTARGLQPVNVSP